MENIYFYTKFSSYYPQKKTLVDYKRCSAIDAPAAYHLSVGLHTGTNSYVSGNPK